MRLIILILSLAFAVPGNSQENPDKKMREVIKWNNKYLRKQYRAVRKIYRYNRQIKHRKDICYGY